MTEIYYTIPGTTDSTVTYWSVKTMTDANDYVLGDDEGAKSGGTYYYVVDETFKLTQGLTVVSGADVVLILLDGKTLTIEAEDGKAGINVTDTLTVDGDWNESRSLTITSGSDVSEKDIDDSGKLHVTGGVGAAGIGGNLAEAGRNIEIDGGTVVANGGIGAAGIGGGWDINGSDCSGGNITITGGTVSALGGANEQYAGAGIGGGDRSSADNITITGGEVTATGGTCQFDVGAAGIGGGGYGGSAEDITITGGKVFASGGGSGADAIGAGAGDGATKGTSTGVNADEDLTVKASSSTEYNRETKQSELVDPVEITHDIESDLSEVTDFHQQYVTIAAKTISLEGAVVKVNGTYTFSGEQIAPTDVTVTLDGVTLVAGDDYTISYGANRNAGAKAGSLIITGKGAYSGQVLGTFEILQASVSVTGSAADSKTYDGTTAATVTGSTLDGKIDSTDVSLVATGTFADKNAGAGKNVLVTYELTGDDAANYKLTSSSESLTADISQKQLTVSDTVAVFDYSGYASADVPAGTTADIVSGDDVEISATATSTSPDDMEQKTFPGSHDMTVSYTLSGDDAGNYTVSDESMSGFIRLVVDAGSGSELTAGTYGNAVAGYAGTTGAVGETCPETEDKDAGSINLKDGVVFSGSNANEKGAFYNAGTANLKGTVTQASANDGIYNEGTLNWDLKGTTKGKLVGYQYLTNAESGELTITLNASDAAGTSYEIATGDFSDTAGKNTFWLNDDEEITIGTEAEYNDKTYRLYVDDNGTAEILDDDKLILKVVTPDPVVTIDTEEKWFKSGDTITISGTAQSYSTGGLEKMEVNGATAGITFEETIPGSKNYTWTYDYTGADTDGTTLTVTATDTSTEPNPGTATYNLKVDTKAPDAALTTTAGYEKDGVTWYKQNATATLNAKVTDATPGSGLDTVKLDGSDYVSETAVTLDTSSEATSAVTKTLVATDVAGNETTKTFTYDVDGTGPEFTDSAITGSNTYRASDDSYWVKKGATDVTASTNVSDAKSGVKEIKLDDTTYTAGTSVQINVNTTAESELTAHTISAEDNVGNASSKTIKVGVDGTGPTIDKVTVTSANKFETTDGTWVKQSDGATVKATITDAKSGLAGAAFNGAIYESGSDAAIDTASESAITDYTFLAKDNVSNESSASVKIGVDGTGPEFTDPTVTGANAYKAEEGKFWVQQNGAATAATTISDAKSGVDALSVKFDGNVYTSGEAATLDTAAESDLADHTFAASDNVTNESLKTFQVGVDGTGPEFTAIEFASTHDYATKDGIWVKMGDVTTAATEITDAKSGVDALSVKFDGASYTSGTAATIDTSAESAIRDYTFAASDNVTNANETKIAVGVDGTGPDYEIVFQSAHKYATDATGLSFWVKQDDAARAKAIVTDAKSGVDASTVTYEGSTYTSGAFVLINTASESAGLEAYTFAASDNVTNASSKDLMIGVDGTGPDFSEITVSSATKYETTDVTWVKLGDTVTAKATVADAKSGVASATFDGAAYTSGTAATIDTSKESSIRDYTFAAEDNVTNASSATIKIGVDGTGPTLVSIVSNPLGWTSESVTLTVTYTDGDGSGVSKLEYSEDNETWSVLAGGKYTSDENRTVYFRATDNVGNVSTVTSYDIENIDRSAPVVTAYTSAIDLTVGTATVVMTASSETINVTDYRINGGEWQTYTGPVEYWTDLRAGSATILFEARTDEEYTSQYAYVAGSEQELYVNKNYKFYAGEKISYGFLKMMGTDKSDTITFGYNSQVQLTGGAVDLSTGSNAIKVERNADVDFICESIANVATLNVAAGTTVSEKKIDETKGKAVSVTYQGVTCADFSSIAFSADWNDTLSVGAYAAVTTGDLSANPKKYNKITVGKNASFTAGDISDFYSIGVTGGAKYAYDSYAVDESTGERLFLKGEQGLTTFAAGAVTTTAKNDTLSFGNFTDVDFKSVQTGLGNDKISLGSDSTLDVKSIDFGAGTDTLTIGAKSTATLGAVTDVEKLTVTAGNAATKTAATIDSLVGSSEELAHTYSFGNYTDVEVCSRVAFKSKNDTLSLGNYAEASFGDEIAFGDGNDTLKIGSDSTFAAQAIDFGALDAATSTDKFTVGSKSVVTIGAYVGVVDPKFVGGSLSGVQSITLSAGKAATKTAAEADTKLFAGDVTMLSAKADTLSIGNYAEVKLVSLTTGTAADSVKIGNYDTVDLGDVFLWDGNDTFSIGSHSEVTAKSLDFGEGTRDKLSLGTDSKLTVEALEVDSIDTLSLGKESYLYLGAASYDDAVTRAKTDKTWAKYIDNGQIAAIA